MYKEVPSKIKMLNLSPTSNTCLETIHGFNPTKPWHDCVNEKEDKGDPKGSKELADKYEDEIDSWLSLNPDNEHDENNSTNGYSCFQNQYQVHCNSLGSTESESLVPLPFAGAASEQLQEQWQNFYLGMEYEMSKDWLVHDPLWSQSVSVPYMEADISPVATMSSTISESYGRNPEVVSGKASSPTIPMQQDFSAMNREAKVQRYREKRKARKYEKKIRYASRQAYAESRPRVKGKFARETDKETDVNPVFSIMDKYSHGIGPSRSFCPTHKT